MKKIISAVLVVSLIATFGFAAMAASDLNEGEVRVNISDTSANHSPIEISSGRTVAQYLNIDKPFQRVDAGCPSYSDNVGNLTLSLYKWAGDYDSTLKTEPIAKKEWVDFKDNSKLSVGAPEGQAFAAGEYLLYISDPVQQVGIWKGAFENLDTDIIQESYLDGEIIEGCHETGVIYAPEGAPLANGSESANPSAPTKVIPKDTENIIMFTNSNTSYVKGAETKLDVAPTVIEGRTFLPARFVAEQLGADVTYIEDSQTVVIEKDELVIALVVGEASIRISGVYQPLDVCTYVTEGRTMVPIRAITEALGMQINYFDPGLIVIGPNAEAFADTMAEAFVELY